jgi:hypothetical protein
MTLALLGGLALLALVDSTSFGTLLIPIWLMLAPGRIRVGRFLVYLGTVAAFYFVVGVLLVAGVARFSDEISDALDTTPVQIAQLVLGLGLLVAGLRLGSTKSAGPSGRLLRWRERAVGENGSVRGLMALAVTAVLIEVASMVPYLAAIGLIGTADVSRPTTVAVLAGYCLVMVLPALVLLGGRIGAAGLVEPLLQRVNAWMERTGRENTAWLLGIIGVILAANALDGLGVLDQIDGWSKDS